MTALETVADAAVARNQASEALIKELVEALKRTAHYAKKLSHSSFEDYAGDLARAHEAIAKAEARHAL